MKKKIQMALSIFMGLTICLSSVSFVSADNLLSIEQELLPFINESIIEQQEPDQKVFCDATLNDPFLDDVVIVTILKEYSELDKTFSKADFPGVDIAEIKYLTSLKDPDEEYKYLNYDEYRQILSLTLTNPGKENVLAAIDTLEENPIVRYAGPSRTDLVVDNYTDNEENILSSSTSPNSDYFDLIDLESAWELTTGDDTVTVGIIDSGIANHPDLLSNLADGWDFYNNNATTSDDTHGHGTHVAGIVTSIAPNATIIPLQVYKSGNSFDTEAIVEAVDYAIRNEIDILNMSFSGPFNQDTEDVLENYSGLACCAAGNDDLSNNDMVPCYPASYDCDNIISVAATDAEDELCDFSNYGVQSVDIGAPGSSIYSTIASGGYGYMSGTSMATPMVAGTAALLLAYNPNLTNYQLRHAILNSVDTLPSLNGYVATGGRLNVYNALCYVLPGNRMRNYVVSPIINTSTNIGYGYVNVWSDRARCNYIACSPGEIIPVTGSASNAFIDQETLFMYYNNSNPVTEAGVLANMWFDSPFATEDISSSFYISSSFFRSSSGSTVYPSVSLRKVLLGDVNSDNKINSTDASLALSGATGSITLTDTQKAAADVNRDGIVSSVDALLISQYVSGQIDTF